jgi:tryptophanyl-tRNA synthetase
MAGSPTAWAIPRRASWAGSPSTRYRTSISSAPSWCRCWRALGHAPDRPLHLGHYHGVLKNWVELQHEYECFFFVADWHALTTHYEDPRSSRPSRLGHGGRLAGRAASTPREASDAVHPVARAGARRAAPAAVDDHPARLAGAGADLQGPAGEAARADLATYGFLGYPLLQSADILIYRPAWCRWARTRSRTSS